MAMFTSQATVSQAGSIQLIQVVAVSNSGNNSGTTNLKTVSSVVPGSGANTIRVLQAIPAKTGQLQTAQTGNMTQPVPVHFVKQIGGHAQVIHPISIGSVKTPLSSPGKIVHIPGARMVTKTGAIRPLKVGDTILPNKATNIGTVTTIPNSTSHIYINQATAIATPPKLMQTSRPVTLRNNAQPVQTVTISENNYLQQSQAPQEPKQLASWTVSPMRCKRANEFSNHDSAEAKKRRTPTTGHEKGSKGLRHFAMLVCEKVKHKRTTTYNEVADELVAEYAASQSFTTDQLYDQKNIRRRVYDALNVLMAMNIIYKDKKDIHWVGLPTNSAQEMQQLETDKLNKMQVIEHKKMQLQELILQQIAFKNLVQRNKRLLQTQGPPASNSAIQLPFIIVNTSKKTVIDCSISNDKFEYLFNFDNTFEIHDDIEVLKRMGMAYGLENGGCSPENLQTALSLVPPVLKPYVQEMAGYPVSEKSSSSNSLIGSFPSTSMNLSQEQGSTINDHVAIKTEIDAAQNPIIMPEFTDENLEEILMNNDTQTSSGSSMTLTGMSSRSSSSEMESQEV